MWTNLLNISGVKLNYFWSWNWTSNFMRLIWDNPVSTCFSTSTNFCAPLLLPSATTDNSTGFCSWSNFARTNLSSPIAAFSALTNRCLAVLLYAHTASDLCPVFYLLLVLQCPCWTCGWQPKHAEWFVNLPSLPILAIKLPTHLLMTFMPTGLSIYHVWGVLLAATAEYLYSASFLLSLGRRLMYFSNKYTMFLSWQECP